MVREILELHAFGELLELSDLYCIHIYSMSKWYCSRDLYGFAQFIDCTAPSMYPLVAHQPFDRAIIDDRATFDRLRTTALARSMDAHVHD